MPTTQITHVRAGRALRLGACAALVAVALLVDPLGGSHTSHDALAATRPAAQGYGWPIEPFFHQHPVRGFFGDPRIGMTPRGMSHSFHFGIDIACPNGTPVYATVDGTVVLESFRPETVSVVAGDGRLEHQYWHIRPAVRHGQRTRAYRTVVGYVVAPWAHVHFAEMRDGRYVNPLRAGALGPFADTTHPTVRNLRIEHAGRTLAARDLSGVVDLVVEASDTTPLAVPGRWGGKPVTPSMLRWRLLRNGRPSGNWTTAMDVRRTIPSDDRYDAVYARWTRQNKISRAGRYRFYLAHGLDTSRLAPGRYAVEIDATDIRGNRTVARFDLTSR